MHDYGRATRTWGSATVVMALAYVGGLKASWMADDIMTDGGRRCVDNLADLRTITLRMFRPTYATDSLHFPRIRASAIFPNSRDRSSRPAAGNRAAHMRSKNV